MMLEVAGLSSHYGRISALRSIDLEVGEGELDHLRRPETSGAVAGAQRGEIQALVVCDHGQLSGSMMTSA